MILPDLFRIAMLWPVFAATALLSNVIWAAGAKPVAGVDISMLPEIEKAGGVYRHDGKRGDAIRILRDQGCNLFRVRLFVEPSTDFNKSYGATQDLAYVRALAKRIKAAGGQVLLDLHYSDTWADGMKQTKPQAWKDLSFEQLEQQVYNYTASVLEDLWASGAAPDMVQIGNEIAGGILWPEGKVLDAPPHEEQQPWQRFARLVNAGSRAVRSAQTDSHRIRIMIHIHGGGRAGLPKWFFGKFNRNPVDYDVIGLSFYPAWGDSIDALKQNMDDVIHAWGKDVLIAETSYPWKPMEGIRDQSVMRWPMTPEGQKQFLRDLMDVIREAPEHRGLGFVWWYPEAVLVPGLHIWRGGAEALFDDEGAALPALELFGQGRQ